MTITMPAGAFMTDDHRYYFNGEGPMPSVTTVIGVLDKPALVTWKARETARAILNIHADNLPAFRELSTDDQINWALKESDKARDTAAKLGSSVHLLADMVPRASESDSETWQMSEQEKTYVDAFRGFLDRYSASNIVSSEKIVWSWSGYAGTYDLLMQIPGDHPHTPETHPELDCIEAGQADLWLLDIKTSKGYYPEYGLQLAAYGYADSIIVPGDPKPYPMPKIDRYGVLHLRPDQYKEGWRLVEYPVTDRDYTAFLGALEVYRWKAERRFTQQILNTGTKPLTPSTVPE